MRTYFISGKLSTSFVKTKSQYDGDKTEKFLTNSGQFEIMVLALDRALAINKARRRFMAADLYDLRVVLLHDEKGRIRWDEEKRAFVRKPLFEPSLRDILDASSHMTFEEIQARREGFAAAKRLYAPEKKAENSLKSSRAWKGTAERDNYERCFLFQWGKLEQRGAVVTAKPKKKTAKPKKKTAKV